MRELAWGPRHMRLVAHAGDYVARVVEYLTTRTIGLDNLERLPDALGVNASALIDHTTEVDTNSPPPTPVEGEFVRSLAMDTREEVPSGQYSAGLPCADALARAVGANHGAGAVRRFGLRHG